MNVFQKTGYYLLSKASSLLGPKMTYSFSSGQWVFPSDNKNAYIDEGYKSLPNLYAIISLIIQKSSIVPFEVYKISNKKTYEKYKATLKTANTPRDIARAKTMLKAAVDKIDNSDLEALLNNPNKSQTKQELFEQIDGYKLLTGNSYLWGLGPDVGLNKGKVQSLIVPPSTMVSIITSGDIMSPVKEYQIDYVDEPIESKDIAHFKYWNPMTSNADISESLYGMSPLVSCRRLMAKYKDADTAQGSMFKNMGPAGILAGERDAGVTEPQANAIKDRWKQLYKGSDKAGEIVVTSANLKWQQIGFSPVDLNILEGKEEMLSELCNVYHVPIGMFSGVNSTENNMIESRKTMITDAVIPLVESRKDVLNKWLAPKFGDDLVIEFDYSIFSEISKEVSELATTAASMWWITANEKRTYTGFDKMDDDNMDKVFMPNGFTEIDQMSQDPMEIIDPGGFIDEADTEEDIEDPIIE